MLQLSHSENWELFCWKPNKNIEILLEGDMWEFQIAHVWTFIFWICWSYFSYVHSIPCLFGQTISNFKHSGWYFSCQRENPGTKIQKTIKHMILYVMFLIYLDIWDLVCPCLLCPCYLSLSWLYYFFYINALFNACHHWSWQKFSWIPLCSVGLHVWGKMVCHLPMSALLMWVLLEYSRFSKQIIWHKRNLQ